MREQQQHTGECGGLCALIALSAPFRPSTHIPERLGWSEDAAAMLLALGQGSGCPNS